MAVRNPPHVRAAWPEPTGLGVCVWAGYFLAPSTCSLKLLDTEKRTFLRAGIFTGSPVCGLRPMRALLCTLRNVPRSGIFTGSPFLTEPTTVETHPSINAVA